MSKGFKSVTPSSPCPACGKGDWCAWTREGRLKCERATEPPNGMRLVKTQSGGALFAPINPDQSRPRSTARRSATVGVQGVPGVQSQHPTKEASVPPLAELQRQFTTAITELQVTELATTLGFTVASLRSIDIGWATQDQLRAMGASGQGWVETYPQGAFTFPERSGTGRVVGYSLRTTDGRKGGPSRAAGASRGLIVPDTFSRAKGLVLAVEGASDVAAATTLGIPAIGRPSNTGGVEQLAHLLKGMEVLVVGERDRKSDGLWPGRDGAIRVASGLAGEWKTAVNWSLPPEGIKDVREWLNNRVAAGMRLDDADAVAAARDELLDALRANQQDEDPPEPPKQAEVVVRLALESNRLGVTDAGEPFLVPNEGPNVCLLFAENRDKLRARLFREYRRRCGSLPSVAAVTDAILCLEGEALDCAQEPVHLRVAQNADTIVLDLGTKAGEAVVISNGSWQVVDRSPVLFRRSVLTGPLPIPQAGGSLEDLHELINIDSATWPLVQGWLVASLIPVIPHPILLFGGEQGTGKTTAGKMLIRLVDPSAAPLRSPPKNDRDWAVATNASWMLLVDNISAIPDWWSDALCKVVTGEGWLGRALYTNSGVTVLTFRRVVILTSIDAGALRGDLGDRLLLSDLVFIPDRERRTERELDRLFTERQSGIVGALLTLVAKVWAEIPNVRLDVMPRMADFAVVLAALDRVQGTNTFELYLGQRGRIATEVVESDVVSAAIAARFNPGDEWSGPASKLLTDIAPNPLPTGWPKSATVPARTLRRQVTALRTMGIEVIVPGKTNKRRDYLVRRNALNAPNAHNGVPTLPSQETTPAGGAFVPGGALERPDERPSGKPPEDPKTAESGRSGVQGVPGVHSRRLPAAPKNGPEGEVVL